MNLYKIEVQRKSIWLGVEVKGKRFGLKLTRGDRIIDKVKENLVRGKDMDFRSGYFGFLQLTKAEPEEEGRRV